MLVGLMNATAYTVLIGAGLANRHRPDRHKRYMYIAMCGLLSAVFGRLPTVPGVIDYLPGLWDHVVWPGVLILALLAWDLRSRGAPHPVTVWAGPALLVWQLSPTLMWGSATWLATADRILAAS
jgi:hypothetical protein